MMVKRHPILHRSPLSVSILYNPKGVALMSKQENEARLVSRRSFLKKTALLSAGAAAAGALVGCSPSTAKSTAAQKWDKEVDLLVVGSGTVIMAAIAGKDAGLESVLVIEKSPAFGGTSALSGGGMWIPLNYSEIENGIEDNREDVLKYLKTVSAGQSTDELMEAYVDNAGKMLEWLRDDHGYTFSIGSTQYNDYYQVDGYRKIGRSVYPIKEGKSAGGPGFWEMLKATATELGVEIMLETTASRLVLNEAGEVAGVVAQTNDGELAIKAKHGVVLGTGGFDFNKDMVDAYLRGPIQCSVAVRTNTGDGQLMGMAIGADLRNMNESWGVPFFPIDLENLRGEADWQLYRGRPGAIVVNKHGERFGNEAASYELFQRAFYTWDTGAFEWRNIPAYFICDSSFTERYFLPGSNYTPGVIPDFMQTYDTLEDLAAGTGIDVDGLMATVEAFNANAEEGKDPIWHRGEFDFDLGTAGDATRTDLKNICLAPIAKGPFYVGVYGPGTCGTSGGLRINKDAQVLNVWGEVIPRLYAVGNTAGSVFGAAYPGGGSTLGQGTVMAMLAARHAATLEPQA
jgi:succinate dehydrogenase/fumarate reductase flavoprotein subunit